MKTTFLAALVVGLTINIACGALDTAKIDQLTGLKGKSTRRKEFTESLFHAPT